MLTATMHRSASGTPVPPDSSSESGARWWRPTFAVLAALAIGVSLLLPSGRHQWALSLFREPTRYTALSFSQAWTLPSSAVIDEPLAVSFTVSNHQGRGLRYHYIISASGGTDRVLAEATKTVAAGATWKVSAMVRPKCSSSPCRIEVSLPGHPESIDFWVKIKKARGRRHAVPKPGRQN